VLALLDIIVHFFKLSLKPLLLLFFTSLLLSLASIFSSRLLLLLAKRQIAELSKNSNVVELLTVSNQLGVPELRRIVGLKVRELAEEARNLCDDSEEVVGGGVIVHLEAFNRLVVLDHWVERALLQSLPIPAKIILGVGVEQQ
jgi:hypothetical protein